MRGEQLNTALNSSPVSIPILETSAPPDKSEDKRSDKDHVLSFRGSERRF